MMKMKQQGLVADLMPNIRVMKIFGHFVFNYYDDNSSKYLHKVYCCANLFLLLLQFGLCAVNLIIESADVDDLTANTITLLFFTHSIVKVVYFAIRSKYFYRTWAIWNNPNSHPLFAESNARYHAIALKKMRLLLTLVGITTLLAAVAWTTLTFFEHPIRKIVDPVTNETEIIVLPQLLVRSFYPFNAGKGITHVLILIYQFYWVLFMLINANSLDVLFCSWLLFACEQLQHLVIGKLGDALRRVCSILNTRARTRPNRRRTDNRDENCVTQRVRSVRIRIRASKLRDRDGSPKCGKDARVVRPGISRNFASHETEVQPRK